MVDITFKVSKLNTTPRDFLMIVAKKILEFKLRQDDRIPLVTIRKFDMKLEVPGSIPSCFYQDSPLVTLTLGSTLNPHDIKEGDDVYFECNVRATQGAQDFMVHNIGLKY
ncbi:hypothetical protein MSG28_006990 [Choristoneura fumiferana]|uniref:Uncharacterized protein n=1 Tax=Choristoneura fumiferana TaxID=7141 RepID=A0ACC0JMB4_CHOFU|nr:hypothetical protein MSG28_006990 [Choristoneura fumiferana]